MPLNMSFWITSPWQKVHCKESGKHLAAQTIGTYQLMINALEACNLNTIAANKQSHDQRKSLRHFEISTS